MKVYIAKCDKFGEEVPLTRWFDGAPYCYKEFWVWIINRPEKTDEGKFAKGNGVTFSEDEIKNQFFHGTRDWLLFQDDLSKMRNDEKYLTELDLFVI